MGQTTSSSGVTTNPALSSSDTPSLPSDYPYGHASSVTSFAPSHQTAGEDVSAPPSDGYRWRKYGQKSVKGSAYARNYYKCTYPGCTVKKQVDKINNNGKIIDQVLCKGEHCHGPPQITRINAHDQQTFRNSVINESLAHTEIMVKHEDSPRYPYGHPGMRTSAGATRPRPPNGAPGQLDGSLPYHQLAAPHDAPQSSLLLTYNGMNNSGNNDTGHFAPATSKKNILNSDSGSSANATKSQQDAEMSSTKDASREAPDTHPTSTNTTSANANGSMNNNNSTLGAENPGATNPSGVGNRALVTQFSANPSQPNTQALVPSATTTVSSPRLVIETNTNVDCLDDGYHWRKYGQKTVKGSPFPRSYYKCTEKGCSVKKQVEQNGTSIVNTYEGTHTHLAPAMDDSSELIKKRRLRRSEGQEMTPYKRMHKSLDDLPPNHPPSEPKSYRFPDCDTAQPSSPHFHNPMPIGSMGSILHHTSHLHSSMNSSMHSSMASAMHTSMNSAMHMNLAGPPLYPSESHAHAFSALSSLGSKPRFDPAPALAPLHSFSRTEHASTPSHKFSPTNSNTNNNTNTNSNTNSNTNNNTNSNNNNNTSSTGASQSSSTPPSSSTPDPNVANPTNGTVHDNVV